MAETAVLLKNFRMRCEVSGNLIIRTRSEVQRLLCFNHESESLEHPISSHRSKLDGGSADPRRTFWRLDRRSRTALQSQALAKACENSEDGKLVATISAAILALPRLAPPALASGVLRQPSTTGYR
jgi:hypothetical protein